MLTYKYVGSHLPIKKVELHASVPAQSLQINKASDTLLRIVDLTDADTILVSIADIPDFINALNAVAERGVT